MPAKPKTKSPLRLVRPKLPEVLDVGTTARMLMVSVDTVYDLSASGTLPARKVGRKWITTKAAILRWIENTSTDDTLARAITRATAMFLPKRSTAVPPASSRKVETRYKRAALHFLTPLYNLVILREVGQGCTTANGHLQLVQRAIIAAICGLLPGFHRPAGRERSGFGRAARSRRPLHGRQGRADGAVRRSRERAEGESA